MSKVCWGFGGAFGKRAAREPHFKEKIKAVGFIFNLFLRYLFISIQDLEIRQCQKHLLVFFPVATVEFKKTYTNSISAALSVF